MTTYKVVRANLDGLVEATEVVLGGYSERTD